MKQQIAAIIGLVLLVFLGPVRGDENGTTTAGQLAERVGEALVLVRCQVNEETGPRRMAGTGICIGKNGLIMTSALDPQLRPESIALLQVVLPGTSRKTLDAELLGIDPLTRLSFLLVKESHAWNTVQFHARSRVKIGDEVISVGLGLDDPALPVTVGMANVSSIRHTPARQVRVTGGTLSSKGSVVFDGNGRAIGLVDAQPLQSYQAVIQQRTVNLSLRNDQRSIRFLPVEEFVDTIRNIPQGGKARRLPWIGVTRFSPIPEDLSEAKNIEGPAVMIDQVIPGGPGDRAGLANRDIVVRFQGKALEDFASPRLVSANFFRELMRLPVGKEVTLTVRRNDRMQKITIPLEPMPQLPNEAKRVFNQPIGLLAREKVMLDEFLTEGPAGGADGLIVVGVVRGSPVATAGLQAGDVVTAINGRPVTTVEQAKTIVDQLLNRNAAIRLTVQRGAETQTLTVRPPK